MRGIGYASFFVISLPFRKSTHNLFVLSFFLTKTIGDDQGPFYGLITSRFNISFNNSFTSCFLCMGILLRLCLIAGSSPVFMLCFTTSVQPMSEDDLENMSSYSLSSFKILSFWSFSRCESMLNDALGAAICCSSAITYGKRPCRSCHLLLQWRNFWFARTIHGNQISNWCVLVHCDALRRTIHDS